MAFCWCAKSLKFWSILDFVFGLGVVNMDRNVKKLQGQQPCMAKLVRICHIIFLVILAQLWDGCCFVGGNGDNRRLDNLFKVQMQLGGSVI